MLLTRPCVKVTIESSANSSTTNSDGFVDSIYAMGSDSFASSSLTSSDCFTDSSATNGYNLVGSCYK